ncbi:MAG: NAD(P)-dependent oxidoreductase [Treponema sp.]|nr:NAD(P)-dependent oxidoreductase [Treponema sp.]
MGKVIVTGATGFIGKELIKTLYENGESITAIIRNKNDYIEQYADDIIICDMDSYNELHKKLHGQYDALYHLAWDGASGEGRADFKKQINNLFRTVELCESAKYFRCKRFVGIGSITQIMYRDYLLKEDITPELTGIYSICKNTAEQITKTICANNDIEHIWTYCANIYGIGDDTGNFINMLVNCYLKGESPCLTAGKQLADFTYITDIANGIFAAASKGINGHSYYIGYGEPKPLCEYVKTANALVNKNVQSGLGKRDFNGVSIDYRNLDITKLSRETGFEAQIPFEKGIKMLIQYERGEYDNN